VLLAAKLPAAPHQEGFEMTHIHDEVPLKVQSWNLCVMTDELEV
jgi:hypothetical protein